MLSPGDSPEPLSYERRTRKIDPSEPGVTAAQKLICNKQELKVSTVSVSATHQIHQIISRRRSRLFPFTAIKNSRRDWEERQQFWWN
jgi:hypothetical protein